MLSGQVANDLSDPCRICKCLEGTVTCFPSQCSHSICTHPGTTICGCPSCDICSYNGITYKHLQVNSCRNISIVIEHQLSNHLNIHYCHLMKPIPRNATSCVTATVRLFSNALIWNWNNTYLALHHCNATFFIFRAVALQEMMIYRITPFLQGGQANDQSMAKN